MNVGYAKELQITSDRLEIDRNNKVSIFSGNTYAYENELQIWADRLTVKFNDTEEDIEELYAENNVKIIKQNITATSDIGIYFLSSNIVKLFNNVQVIENGNFIKCDELILDINNSTSIMKSGSSNRVEALINKTD